MTGGKQYQNVQCNKCLLEYIKRKDSIKNWNGLCAKCSLEKVNNDPKMKEVHRANGLAIFAKYGKLAAPKIENRRRGEGHHFWGVSLIGDKAHNWQGGKTTKNEIIRHSLEYRQWRELVFKRDNYTCTFCGDDKGGNLNADHIKPFALFIDLRFSVDNGRTLCEPCHDKYGVKVGNGVITREAKFNHNGTSWVSA